tara:strand:+ start:832 stop:954 length:123 start_codon:yes stop_codon:yes gene_type:complete
MKSLNKVVLSLQEIWAATRPNVFKNKKKYSRKNKHKASLK